MTSFIQKLISDDFVWTAISENLPGQRRRQNGGGVGICCPMCTSRGESPDKKYRCGIKNNSIEIVVHCFNCGFIAKHRAGELLSKPMRGFLEGIGISEIDVKRLNHKAAQYRSMFEASPEAMALLPEVFVPTFPSSSLPTGSRSFEDWAEHFANTEPSSDFIEVVDYLYSRGEEIANSSTYYWTPDKKNEMNRRIIVPFWYDGSLIGYTARSIDQGSPKRYHMESPANYLYNSHLLTAENRKYIVIVEGIFDAIAIDGVGTLGARLNAQQIAWINSNDKVPIVVPDRDKQGGILIDIALEQKWHVAFPALREGHTQNNWWEATVKDSAEAVKRYGRLWCLLSIIQTATKNRTKIELNRKVLY